MRDADELHDALSTLDRAAAGAAVAGVVRGARRAAPRDDYRWRVDVRRALELARIAYPEATIDAADRGGSGERRSETREEAVAEILRGWLESQRTA